MKAIIITGILFFILGLMLTFSGCVMPNPEDNKDYNALVNNIDTIVQGNNEFAFNLYNQLPKTENQFFSPYSISSAFAILTEASKGNTKKELDFVFGFPDNALLRPGYSSIYKQLNKDSSEYQLSTANALWVNKDFKLFESYVNNVTTVYGAKLENIDFSDADNATKVINNWVEDKTNNKIQNILQPGFINSDTRIIIANAIYFKGKWVNAFKEKYTEEKDFTKDDGTNIKVNMMQLFEEKFRYYEDDSLQAIELPYKGNDLSMIVILPKSGLNSIPSFSNKDYNNILNGLGQETVDLYLPKFKLEITYNKLKSQLENLGLKETFTTDADLSGFTGNKDLFVSDVLHKAFVEVKEEGTEAAAATVIGVATSAMPIDGLEIKEFNANHPFMFLIVQNKTKNILFLGSIVEPMGN